jgi:glycosyltransferase involved in cell wall biosynthesis
MTLKKIFILAPYPTLLNIKDGMIQRIKVIDDLLAHHERVYINLGLKNPIYKKVVHGDQVTELFMNPLFPLYIITKFILKARIIYLHSIHPFKYLPYAFWFLNRKKHHIILDAHGVVPEEILLYGKKLNYGYMRWVEKKVFQKLSHCICVSSAMVQHFKARYNELQVNYHILFTSELLKEPPSEEVKLLSAELGIGTEDIVIIYSGNTQLWQNIPMMLDCIKSLKSRYVKFIILSGDLSEFERRLAEKQIDRTHLILRSVLPNQLSAYYRLSHYGFILRNDIVVNRVANPTKMLEYLQFGIRPVVLSPYVGDYFDLGYDFTLLGDLIPERLNSMKSSKNIAIANSIVNNRNEFDINRLLSR